MTLISHLARHLFALIEPMSLSFEAPPKLPLTSTGSKMKNKQLNRLPEEVMCLISRFAGSLITADLLVVLNKSWKKCITSSKMEWLWKLFLQQDFGARSDSVALQRNEVYLLGPNSISNTDCQVWANFVCKFV